MRRLHSASHVSSRAPNTRELIIDIFEKVSFSPYIFLYEFAAIVALVRTRNRHLVPNFWQWVVKLFFLECSFVFTGVIVRVRINQYECFHQAFQKAWWKQLPLHKSLSESFYELSVWCKTTEMREMLYIIGGKRVKMRCCTPVQLRIKPLLNKSRCYRF